MEYTRSIGDHYESFEGTPKEITELIFALDNQNKKPPKIKFPPIPTLANMKIPSGGILKGGEQ